jgi:hypothetical protein
MFRGHPSPGERMEHRTGLCTELVPEFCSIDPAASSGRGYDLCAWQTVWHRIETAGKGRSSSSSAV